LVCLSICSKDIPWQAWGFLGAGEGGNAMQRKIPNLIHYIWFGGTQQNELHEQCIESWATHAPDCTIVRWDESNCNITENAYVTQAYRARKWAFVSDYFRFKILAEHGGIYADTDMEFHKPIESLLAVPAFFAFEKQDIVHAGIMGSIPKHPIIMKLLQIYKNQDFDMTPVPRRVTCVLRKNGLRYNGRLQTLNDGSIIYPANYLTLNLGDDHCIAEHHYAFSWRESGMKETYKEYVTREFHKNGILWDIERAARRMYRTLRNPRIVGIERKIGKIPDKGMVESK